MILKKILVVEDELIIALDINNILKKEGYEVMYNIVNYQQCIKAIDDYNPDLVLIDIKLKGDLGGIDIGAFIDKNIDIPYIYISSCTDELTLIQLKKHTMPASFIVKPFRPIDLKTTVEIVLHTDFKKKKINIEKDEIPLQLQKVLEYIKANIYNKINMADLYLLTTWNEQNFAKIFKKYIKITPYQYIIKEKINYAKKVLIEHEVCLKDLSFDLGFYSYSNFYNAFVKYTDCAPEKFKKINKK